MYISNIDVTCGSASYSDYCTTIDTSTPSITADNTLEIPAAETEDTFNVTWTGFGDDMIEVNLYNNEACTVAFNGDWFEVELDDDNNVYYLAGENTSTSPRTVYMQLFGLDSEANEYTHVVTVTQAGKQGDPEITNFIKTSTLELVVGAEPYDISNCLNIPSDYDTSTYAITTTINGLTQKDGEYACVYPYIAFSKAGEYTVHVVAAAMPGKYAQTEGNITVTVTDPAPAITTIPALFTKATEVGGTDTDINLTLNNWVVSGVNGKNAYVTDGTNGFIIYQESHGFTAGNVLNGTVACKVLLYNGAAEIKGLTSSTTGLTVTTGGTITPRTTTIGALENINVGSVITLENVSFDAPNLTDGENTIQPYTSLYNYPNTTFTQGTHYNVTGVYILFKSGSNIIKEILPRSAEDIEEVQAEKYAINIAPCENGTVTASLEEAAAGVEVTLTVTPDSGYQLSTLTVTNATTSEAITVTSNTFIMPAAAVNVAATFEEEAAPGSYTYNLVTDASTLAAGDVIVLGCSSYNKAAGAKSGDYLTAVNATISNGILESDDAIEFTLGTKSGLWTLSYSEGTIGATAAKKLSLTSGTTTWDISIANNGNATIQSTQNTYGSIQYNHNGGTNSRFLNYTSGQTAIQIYKKTLSTPKTLTSITLDGQTTTFTEGDTFNFGGTVTAHYDDESTKDVTSSATFSDYDMSTAGTQTVTVSYTENEVTKTATYDITVEENTLPTYTLVTDANTLAAGDVIVLGYKSSTTNTQKASGAFDSKQTYLTAVDAIINNGILSCANANEITLGGSAGHWTLTASEGLITTSEAKAFTIDNGTANTWTISIDDDGDATIESTTEDYGTIQYNAGSPRFLNYTSNQSAIGIYRKASLTTITVSKYGSTTLSLDKDYTMPEGLTGKIITAKKHKENEGDGYYTLTYVTKYNAGDVVPAGEALVIQGEQGDYRAYKGTATGEVTSYPDNLLCAEYTEDASGKWLTSFNNGVDNYYYKLTTKNSANFGWYWGNNSGEPFLMTSKERAYLVIDKETASAVRGFTLAEGEEEDITTFIESLTNNELVGNGRIYNLQGQMMNKLQKGINIVNGKKVIR
ncbi:MAG: bacterial Ig-like domain-containing protein [Bacteroidaceae bacterium]|nr:bacterial Ig-like domain-containing protein [Bacteroidaceae bacterium]